MASFEVKVFPIKVESHPDPETTQLECARIGDYRVVVKKGEYQTGDKVAYIPEDSLLPQDLIKKLGLEGRLAGGAKNRVKPIRLRGQLSQGLVYPMPDKEVGDNVTEELEIIKYEPPIPTSMSGQVEVASGQTIKFDIEPFKLYPDLFSEDEQIVLTEKIHGTWTCLGLYENKPIVASKGLSAKGLIYRLDDQQNPDLIYYQQWLAHQDKINSLSEKLKADTFYVLGEVYGRGVQDLDYGLSQRDFRVFDIYVGKPRVGDYLDYQDMLEVIDGLFQPVPELYQGLFKKETVYHYANAKDNAGKSILADHVREGVVVRPLKEGRDLKIGRRLLKCTAERYDLRKSKNRTDYQ